MSGKKNPMADIAEHIFFPPSESVLFDLYDKVCAKLPPERAALAAAFRHNILSVRSALLVPFNMANTGAVASDLQRRLTDELVARAEDEREGKAVFRDALFTTLEKMVDETRTPEVRKESTAAIVAQLNNALRYSPGFADSMKDMLRQGTASLWGAFEVLLLDCYEVATGQEPTSVRKAIQTLLPYRETHREMLEELGLWLLFQCRHLIVHKLGRVNQKFIDETGMNLPLGSTLAIPPLVLRKFFEDVVLAGSVILLRSTVDPATDQVRKEFSTGKS